MKEVEAVIRFSCPETKQACDVSSTFLEIEGPCENDEWPSEHFLVVDCPACRTAHKIHI